MDVETDDGGVEFRDWYLQTSPRVYAYIRRYCSADDCDDVLAEVYLAAWRKFYELPTDAVPWLIGAARKVLANTWRSRGRGQRLTAALATLDELAGPDISDQAIERTDLLRAVAALKPADQEVLLLAGWDGLGSAEIADVLNCSQVAARARLSRARSRFTEQLTPSGLPNLITLSIESQMQ